MERQTQYMFTIFYTAKPKMVIRQMYSITNSCTGLSDSADFNDEINTGGVSR